MPRCPSYTASLSCCLSLDTCFSLPASHVSAQEVEQPQLPNPSAQASQVQLSHSVPALPAGITSYSAPAAITSGRLFCCAGCNIKLPKSCFTKTQFNLGVRKKCGLCACTSIHNNAWRACQKFAASTSVPAQAQADIPAAAPDASASMPAQAEASQASDSLGVTHEQIVVAAKQVLTARKWNQAKLGQACSFTGSTANCERPVSACSPVCSTLAPLV